MTVVNRALLRGPQPYAPPNIDNPPCLTVELFYDNVAGAPEAERLRDALPRRGQGQEARAGGHRRVGARRRVLRQRLSRLTREIRA